MGLGDLSPYKNDIDVYSFGIYSDNSYELIYPIDIRGVNYIALAGDSQEDLAASPFLFAL